MTPLHSKSLFKRLKTVEKKLYTVELLKSTIEHRTHHGRILHAAVCKGENFRDVL